jgi:hypothetical protein
MVQGMLLHAQTTKIKSAASRADTKATSNPTREMRRRIRSWMAFGA